MYSTTQPHDIVASVASNETATAVDFVSPTWKGVLLDCNLMKNSGVLATYQMGLRSSQRVRRFLHAEQPPRLFLCSFRCLDLFMARDGMKKS